MAVFLSDASLEASEPSKAVAASVKLVELSTGYVCHAQKEWRPSDFMMATLPNPAILCLFSQDDGCREFSSVWDQVMTEFSESSKEVELHYRDFFLSSQEYKARAMGLRSSAVIADNSKADEPQQEPELKDSLTVTAEEGDCATKKKRSLTQLLQEAKTNGVLPSTFEMNESSKAFKLLGDSSSCVAPVTMLNACVLLEKARHLPKHSILFAQDFKPISKFGQVSHQLPEKSVRGSLLTCSGGKRAGIRKVLPVEILGLKLWPHHIYNTSMISDQAALGQAVSDCLYLPAAATLLFAIAQIIFG